MATDHLIIRDSSPPTWRADVDALAFRPEGHDGICMVHRRAFRTLLKRVASADDCADFFRCHEAAFQAAARAKIAREALGQGTNFHLTSRDVGRQLGILAVARSVDLR